MKTLALLFMSLCLSASASELPSFRGLPGHLVQGQCDPFSKAAVLKLHKAGIPAVRILMRMQNPGATAFHAALIFKQDGRFYVMDNEHTAPMQFKGKTDLSAALRLAGADFNTSVCIVDEWNRKVQPHKLEALFKPNPEWLEKYRIDNR